MCAILMMVTVGSAMDKVLSDWSVLGLECSFDTPEVPDVGVNMSSDLLAPR
jgi:hypothetical protein